MRRSKGCWAEFTPLAIALHGNGNGNGKSLKRCEAWLAWHSGIYSWSAGALLMLKPIPVPPLGEQKQTQTTLNFWYVEEGARVAAGDDLAELVTDKAAFNLPAPEAGKVVRILV